MVKTSWKYIFSAISQSETKLRSLIPQIVQAAQNQYNQWDASDPEMGDGEVGFGGICDLIADSIADVINMAGFEATTIDSNGMGEQHVWVAVNTPDGIYEIDIPPCVYETGSGYSWQKIPGIQFQSCHVDIYRSAVDNWEDITMSSNKWKITYGSLPEQIKRLRFDSHTNAREWALDNETANTLIVHGSVVDPNNKRIKHTWVEQDGIVIDPTFGWKMPIERYYRIIEANCENVLTPEQCIKQDLKTKWTKKFSSTDNQNWKERWQNINWPHRQGTGDDPHENDSPPEMTSSGDYILYHGTSDDIAKKIMQDKRFLADDIGCVGVCTTPSAASVFGSMKVRRDTNRKPLNQSCVLQLTVDGNWFRQQNLTRECGGSGRDQWLITNYEKRAEIPPESIKDIKIWSISGERV